MSPFKARKYAMLVFAVLVTPIVFAQSPGISTWGAVGLIALAASSHQAWSANIFTTVSDAFPKRAVSSVTGIGGMAGALGGLGISYLAGAVLNFYKNAGHVETELCNIVYRGRLRLPDRMDNYGSYDSKKTKKRIID